MPKLELVPDTVITTAYGNFRDHYFPNQIAMGMYFWNFLGMTKGPDTGNNGWMLPPKVAHRARLLAGPHFLTIAKALELKGHDPKKCL